MKKPKLDDWNWRFEDNRGCKDIFAGDNRIAVGFVGFTTGCANESQDRRNAKMICSAPQMALELELLFSKVNSRLKKGIRKVLIQAGYRFKK